MKRYSLTTLIIIFTGMSTAYAVQLPTNDTIKITGTLEVPNCKITPADAEFGTLNANDIASYQIGSHQVVANKDVSIQISDCAAYSTVHVTVTFDADYTHWIKHTGTARGLDTALLQHDVARGLAPTANDWIDNGTTLSANPVNGTATIPLYAVLTRAGENVQSGNLSASATLTYTFD